MFLRREERTEYVGSCGAELTGVSLILAQEQLDRRVYGFYTYSYCMAVCLDTKPSVQESSTLVL